MSRAQNVPKIPGPRNPCLGDNVYLSKCPGHRASMSKYSGHSKCPRPNFWLILTSGAQCLFVQIPRVTFLLVFNAQDQHFSFFKCPGPNVPLSKCPGPNVFLSKYPGPNVSLFKYPGLIVSLSVCHSGNRTRPILDQIRRKLF